MNIITLTTDYGHEDPYRAQVVGGVYSLLPEARVVDLGHEVSPGNLMQASYLVGSSYRSFPKSTVHLILVTEITENRRWLAMEMEGQYFIASDSGVLSLIEPGKKPRAMVEISYKRDPDSRFPALDFLIDAACHLARGGQLNVLGSPTNEFKSVLPPSIGFLKEPDGIRGAVVHVDRYGNLITNISQTDFDKIGRGRKFSIELQRNKAINRLAANYDGKAQDGVLAIFNSKGLLEIAYKDIENVPKKGAHALLGLDVNSMVVIHFLDN